MPPSRPRTSRTEIQLRKLLVERAKERSFSTWLSNKTGISEAMLSRLINGTRRMGIRSIEAIAKPMGYKLELVPLKGAKNKN